MRKDKRREAHFLREIKLSNCYRFFSNCGNEWKKRNEKKDKSPRTVLIVLVSVVFFKGANCLIRRHVFLQASATGQDLYNVITEHLGLTETIFFGLMIIKGD